MKIINVKEFKAEYTAVFVNTGKELTVRRCNKVCSDCGVKISENIGRELEGFATTFRKAKCDLCLEDKHVTNIRHYN